MAPTRPPSAPRGELHPVAVSLQTPHPRRTLLHRSHHENLAARLTRPWSRFVTSSVVSRGRRAADDVPSRLRPPLRPRLLRRVTRTRRPHGSDSPSSPPTGTPLFSPPTTPLVPSGLFEPLRLNHHIPTRARRGDGLELITLEARAAYYYPLSLSQVLLSACDDRGRAERERAPDDGAQSAKRDRSGSVLPERRALLCASQRTIRPARPPPLAMLLRAHKPGDASGLCVAPPRARGRGRRRRRGRGAGAAAPDAPLAPPPRRHCWRVDEGDQGGKHDSTFDLRRR